MGRMVRLVRNVYSGEIAPWVGYDPDCELLDLVYDPDTCVVYYKFTEIVNVKPGKYSTSTKVGYLSPYLGAHGKPCRLERGQIVEIQ